MLFCSTEHTSKAQRNVPKGHKVKDVVQDRVAQKFRQIDREGRTGIILFLTAGFPDMNTTLELVPALAQAGADCIELGVPFSDPMADGLTIQASSFEALKGGVTLDSCIKLVDQLRDKVPDTPLILMGYYNPILSYGPARFGAEAQRAGVDGVIVPDLPPDESGLLREECEPRGIHIIPMLAPTSTDVRIEKACRAASGFIYCVSLTGVTGARDELPSGVFSFLERVRRHTDLPLTIGFGISRREHVESVSSHVQAVAVGSALVRVITDSPSEELIERVQKFVGELNGAMPSPKGGQK